ncbi:MAG: HNH endonuclease signature motif containing protein [Deltaproteobacteria bacterium]|jgi:hypothetical protein|nr:HNH endonuclease signature motif containing protein [SAR324 cluster bacterium]MEC7683873.1 HNH endonuclease signature motif containing protein [SAR324 cluster bacterium]MEC8183941.1 HNH endonuclease signature motif containing protein [SAR324 cluster bacterium]MED5290261.1 HNH endonuclease signature motif containing protein [SAR324 cluster bacterium]GIR61625.1 MAG: hypothetical protein CM15mP66_10730 [Pseudomonadota bacterium]|tara:strand:+ start:88 stop:498 length:411 start_codon:yes stop_codon:yes gene_type:complete
MAHDPRYHQEWPEISKYVRLLFNHHCARCGKDCSNPSNSRDLLQVHHIDENPGNNQLENLIPLCSVCHLQIEKEARLHAPHAHIQHELFEDSSYLESMATLRKEAFERYGQKQKNSISNMSDEEYEQYLNQKEWEE